MNMIGTYWTIEYINANTKRDETHTLRVDSINGGVLRVSCYFPVLKLKNSRNTLESSIKQMGRPATPEEIAAYGKAFE